MGQMRRRVVQMHSLEERLARRAKQLFKQVAALPPTIKTEAVRVLARQAEVAALMSEWVSAPGASILHLKGASRLSRHQKKRRDAVG